MAKKCDGAQWQHLRVTPLLCFVCPCCPVSLSLSWPCPLLLLLLPRALSHMLSLALSSYSQTRESAAPGSHLHLSCFSFAPLPSCCTLSTSTYCHSAAETLLGKTKIPRLCIRGKTQEKEKPAGEIDWGSLTELRSLCSSLAFDDWPVLLTLLWKEILKMGHLIWAQKEKKKRKSFSFFLFSSCRFILLHRTKWCTWRGSICERATEDRSPFTRKIKARDEENPNRDWAEESNRGSFPLLTPCPVCSFPLRSPDWSPAMQVSIACTDHNLKRGNGDHSKQSATSPNVVNQARAKFRTVAIIARSFGSFTPRHISLKESTGKHTGMKYRCVRVCVNNVQCTKARGTNTLFSCVSISFTVSQYFSVILTYKNALISVEMCLYSLISFSVDVTFDHVFLANVFFLQNRDPKFSDKDSLDASALI